MLTFPNVKINLGLNIVNRRANGYHDIESVFCPVGLTDVLDIALPEGSSTDVQMVQSGLDCGVTDIERNLCVKAYRALASEVDLPHVAMHLHKNVPTGAGLGGGSSDATAVLVTLNEMLALGLSSERIKAIAARVGCDCPFFVDNQVSYVSGLGDVIEPFDLSVINGLGIVIVKPDVFVSTADAYRGCTPARPSKNVREVLRQDISTWRHDLVNDFETTVFRSAPVLAEIKASLYAKGAVYAQMSGSGASLFGLFEAGVPMPTKEDFPGCFFWSGSLGGHLWG